MMAETGSAQGIEVEKERGRSLRSLTQGRFAQRTDGSVRVSGECGHRP